MSSTLTEARRLATLQHLSALAEYRANGDILIDVLNGRGIPTSLDQMRQTLAWLDEAELLRLDHAGDTTVAELTARGAEAARGTVTVPGVARPKARA
ncbi:MAG: VpaChn25_0724 family phage protein [Paracoccaceae bacterium]